MRTFFCIPLPDPVRAEVEKVADQLRSRTRMRASWVPRENYHVTLQFLGDIDPDLTVELDRVCRELCRRHEPFGCTVDRVGAFPSLDRARVLWMGGEAPQAFRRLAFDLSAGLAGLGFAEARSESLTHITLARINDRADPALPDVVRDLSGKHRMDLTVDQIVLMESTLTQRGAKYAPLFTVPLLGGRA